MFNSKIHFSANHVTDMIRQNNFSNKIIISLIFNVSSNDDINN